MIVQLDVDGILADFVGGSLAVMRVMGYDFEPHHVVEWDVDVLLPEAEREEFWRRLRQPGFCAGLTAYSGARKFVGWLRKNHEVRFLTSPMHDGNPHWEPERAAWLERHFGDVPVTFAKQKHIHLGDVLVDDKPEHCEAWAATGRPAILFDRPYNRHVSAMELGEVFRAPDYAGVLWLVKQLEESRRQWETRG